ncbi:uncharacterized protein ACIBXB_021682 isoform 2-T2 [Morphnus guianensis]
MKNAFALKLLRQNGEGRIIQKDDGMDKRKSPVLLCYPAGKPDPRSHMLNQLRHSRENVNKESSFTAVQLGADPKDSHAGGRLKRCRQRDN